MRTKETLYALQGDLHSHKRDLYFCSLQGCRVKPQHSGSDANQELDKERGAEGVVGGRVGKPQHKNSAEGVVGGRVGTPKRKNSSLRACNSLFFSPTDQLAPVLLPFFRFLFLARSLSLAPRSLDLVLRLSPA